MKRFSSKFTFIFLTLSIASLYIAIATYQPTANLFAQTQLSSEGTVSNCRYGLAALGNAQINTMDTFGAGAHLGFTFSAPPAPNNADFFPMITFHQNKDFSTGEYLDGYTTIPNITSTNPSNQAALRYWLEQNPGSVWILGNEIDRGPDEGQTMSGQDDLQPYWYAVAYHDVYKYIKTYDPTATVATAALVQVTPARLAYWDEVWDAYQTEFGTEMPVDVWTMHLYILPEVKTSGAPNGIANYPVGLAELGYDPAVWGRYESGGNAALCPQDNVYCFAEHDDMTVFAEQITDMRQWMKDHGQQQKPLLITEYSLLYPFEDDGGSCFLQDEYGNCFEPDRVQTFLENTFAYLESEADPNLGYALDGNRLVQQWFWFAIHHEGPGSVSNLFDDVALTQVSQIGTAYANWVNATTVTQNLVTIEASNAVVQIPAGSTDVDVAIRTWFTNNGNLRITDSFDVTFYSNAGLTNVIGTATISPAGNPLQGCAVIEFTADTTWNDLTEGTYTYWASIDDGNAISETNEGDNVISGTVIVTDNWLGLPVIRR